MLNHYSQTFRAWSLLLPVFFLSCFIAITVSCNKSSNQLKPFYDHITFSKTIDYNGSTLLLVDFEQKMYVGQDTLKVTISNPTTDIITDWEVLIYVQKADEFEQTLDYRYKIKLQQLAPQGDTTIILTNYDLPLEESQVQVGLLNKGSGTNPLWGVYDGQVGYIMGNDTLPSSYSFSKGVVYADGTFSFWMKSGSVNKKLSGQFIDTLSMNSIYKANDEITSVTGILDSIDNGTNYLKLRVNLSGQPGDIENKLWFNLNK